MSRRAVAFGVLTPSTHPSAQLQRWLAVQVVVKGRLGLDRTADYLEELRAHSRSRAASVVLLSPPPDTDPDDLDHLERVGPAAWGLRVV